MGDKGKPQHKLYKSVRKRVAPPTMRHEDRRRERDKNRAREKIRPQDWYLYNEDIEEEPEVS